MRPSKIEGLFLCSKRKEGFMNKSKMDKYEDGKDIPNTDRIIQYAYIGKVSLEFLIYGI